MTSIGNLPAFVTPDMQCLQLVLQCRACRSVLPPEAHLSSDVGSLFGVPGQLDFMLMPLRWGFQLLSDGQATKEDVDRQICAFWRFKAQNLYTHLSHCAKQASLM